VATCLDFKSIIWFDISDWLMLPPKSNIDAELEPLSMSMVVVAVYSGDTE
jgi:hypothetical protein